MALSPTVTRSPRGMFALLAMPAVASGSILAGAVAAAVAADPTDGGMKPSGFAKFAHMAGGIRDKQNGGRACELDPAPAPAAPPFLHHHLLLLLLLLCPPVPRLFLGLVLPDAAPRPHPRPAACPAAAQDGRASSRACHSAGNIRPNESFYLNSAETNARVTGGSGGNQNGFRRPDESFCEFSTQIRRPSRRPCQQCRSTRCCSRC